MQIVRKKKENSRGKKHKQMQAKTYTKMPFKMNRKSRQQTNTTPNMTQN